MPGGQQGIESALAGTLAALDDIDIPGDDLLPLVGFDKVGLEHGALIFRHPLPEAQLLQNLSLCHVNALRNSPAR